MFTAPAAAQRNVHVPVSGVNAIPRLGASLDGARLGPVPLLMSALSPGALIPALAPALVQPAPAAGILAAAAKPAEGSPLGVIRGASANEAQKTAALDRLFENSAPSEHSKGIGAGSKRSPASRSSPSSRRKRTEPPAAGAPLSSPSQENISPTVLITHLSEVFAVRFNENDGVELKTSDLAASRILTVRELAAADRDGNGWVTVHEVLSTQGMSGSAYLEKLRKLAVPPVSDERYRDLEPLWNRVALLSEERRKVSLRFFSRTGNTQLVVYPRGIARIEFSINDQPFVPIVPAVDDTVQIDLTSWLKPFERQVAANHDFTLTVAAEGPPESFAQVFTVDYYRRPAAAPH